MTREEALKPKLIKGKLPTLTGNPPLGYLNSLYCPSCGRLFTSFYDADNLPNREDGYRFNISRDWNYCIKCGQLIDFSEYRHENKQRVIGLMGEEIVFED